MKNIYFFQCQENYGNNMYLPYSSGILWAYISQFPEIRKSYKMIDLFFEKKLINQYIECLDDPKVLLFSNYGWNTNYHNEVAKKAKEKFPECVIIIGGPNAQQDETYLREHNYIDFSVWGEGENTLLELLTALSQNTNLELVNGISYINHEKGYVKTKLRERKININDIPSPYLSGIFDNFFDRYSYNFMPIWETNRGCPYHCAFCDLGNDYYNKLFEFDDDRLRKEIKWFSDKRIEYVEIADANFCILPRDLDLVKYIKKLHVDTGYPKKISATWAKNSPDRVFEASRILESMNRGGVTLALQSQNKSALDNIKRINIANDRLEQLSKKYTENNIQTYHDFIIGIPGETINSWKKNLLYILDINPDGWIFGHPLEAYKNTELSDPDYIKKHNLIFAKTPQVSFFAKRRKDIPVEYGNYVISTNTLSSSDYIDCFLFKWFLITNHSLGWMNGYCELSNEKPSIFYNKFHKYILEHTDTLVYQELEFTKKHLYGVISNGEFWGRQMFGDEDIYWDYESSSCIVYQQNRERFFDEAKTFMNKTYKEISETNLLETEDQIIKYDDKLFVNFKEFCEQIYWYGRRTKAWKRRKHES